MTVDSRQDRDLNTIVRLIGERSGLSFRSSQLSTLETEIQRGMERAGSSDLRSYRRRLEEDSELLDDLLIELTVGETYFFRDPWHFDFVRDTVLPELQRLRGAHFRIRAWTAGCASGEEAYSLAILLNEAGLLERARILATDISRRALERARRATYRQWSLRGPRVGQVLPYLVEQDGQLLLSDHIRRHVHFDYLNLALDSYPSIATGTRDMDVIFCRNVMIYFDRDTVRAVAHRLFRSLAPGGWLITAASDPLVDGFAEFETVVTPQGLVFRRPLEGQATAAAGVGWPSAGSALQEGSQHESPAEKSSSPAPPPAQRDAPGKTCHPSRVSDALLAIGAAEQALSQGEYRRVIELLSPHEHEPQACYLWTVATANLDTQQAEVLCRQFTERHRFSPDLFHLLAILLIELNRLPEAAEAARKVVYLDPELPMAHYTLGSILRRVGDIGGAKRAFRNAAQLCGRVASDQPLALADGEVAGDLRRAAQHQFESLRTDRGGTA